MEHNEAQYLHVAFEELLEKFILTQKIEIESIPFEVRKYSRRIYIAGNRVTRYNKEKHIAYAKLILSDYSQMTPAEQPVLRELVEEIKGWAPDVYQKAALQNSKGKGSTAGRVGRTAK